MSMSTIRVLGLRRALPLQLKCAQSTTARLPLLRPTSARLFSVGLNKRPMAMPTFARGYATQPPPSEMAEVAATLPESEAVPIVEATTDALGAADSLIQAVPPLAYGDFATLGLSSWSPIGLIAWSYELINVSIGLPWFYTIVAGSALWRFVCVPFALANIRNSTKLRPFQGQIMQARERMTAAQQSKDTIELQRAGVEMKKVYEQAGVSPFGGMIIPMFAQLPITIGMFFALRRMCALPLEQLKDSGVSLSLDLPWSGPVEFLSDLTATDPTYILPVTFCALINIQIAVGAREMDMSTPGAGHMMNLFRAMSLLTIWLMSAFPQGLFLGLLTTSSLTIAQSLLLRLAPVRRLCGIPVINRAQHGKLPSFMQSIRYAQKMLADKQAAAEAAQRQQQQGGIRRITPRTQTRNK